MCVAPGPTAHPVEEVAGPAVGGAVLEATADKEAAAAAAAAEDNALVVAHFSGVGVGVGGDFTSVPDDDIPSLMGKEQASPHRVPLSSLFRSVRRMCGSVC